MYIYPVKNLPRYCIVTKVDLYNKMHFVCTMNLVLELDGIVDISELMVPIPQDES